MSEGGPLRGCGNGLTAVRSTRAPQQRTSIGSPPKLMEMFAEQLGETASMMSGMIPLSSIAALQQAA